MSGDENRDRPDVTINYIKSAFFRVIHMDGAIGGVTPRGLIHCSIYSERAAIPRIVRHPLKPDGTLGEGQPVESREGIAREMEVDLILDEQVARDLCEWLERQLRRLRQLKEEGTGGEGLS